MAGLSSVGRGGAVTTNLAGTGRDGVEGRVSPHSLPPVLRGVATVVIGDDLAATRPLSTSLSSSGRLRVQGILGPLVSRPSTPPPEGGRTRLVFWPHAGPSSRRGSQLEYEVSRRSHDSLVAPTAASVHDASMDSLSELDVSFRGSKCSFGEREKEERSRNVSDIFVVPSSTA